MIYTYCDLLSHMYINIILRAYLYHITIIQCVLTIITTILYSIKIIFCSFLSSIMNYFITSGGG